MVDSKTTPELCSNDLRTKKIAESALESLRDMDWGHDVPQVSHCNKVYLSETTRDALEFYINHNGDLK